MRIFFITLATLFLCLSCAPQGEQPPGAQGPETDLGLGSLFIIGGGSRPPALVERMIMEAGLHEQGYAVILPMASAEPDSAIIWSGEQFLAQGVTDLAGFNILPGIPVAPSRLDSIAGASLIYISGGDQNRFMDIVLDTPVMEAIWEAWRKGAMIAGTSAGAAVMSEKMITGNERRYPEYQSTFRTIEAENIELARGLGLVATAIIDQHFVYRSRHNRLISAVIEFPDLLGIGIDESTAILVRGDTAEVVGASQVLVFKSGENDHRVMDHKLGAKNLRLDVYLPGESFTLR
jgi:cyanophycinase